MIYFVILFIIIFSPYILQDRKRYFFFVSVILVLLAGLRANFIGPDTQMYQYIYENIESYGLGFIQQEREIMETKYEIGYFYLQYFISRYYSYNVFKFICSAISILPACYVIYRYSKKIWLSMFVFFSLPIYTMMGMSMMRQGCAFGLCMIAYVFFIKKRFLFFFLLVLAASLFHESALVFLPVYIINYIGLKPSYFKYIALVLIIVAINATTLFVFLNRYSRLQYTAGAAGGYGTLIFMLLLLICCFCFIDKTKFDNTEIKILVYMLVYTIMLWFIGMNLAAIFRLAAYTEFFICLYVSNVFSHIKDDKIRNTIQFVTMVICVYIMKSIVLSTDRGTYGYYPFSFIWE